MQINLFDPEDIRVNLLPLTYTRPVAEIRVGILKISEKWKQYGFQVGFLTEGYLATKYRTVETSLIVNGALCPDPAVVTAIRALKPGQQLMAGELSLATYGEAKEEVTYEEEFALIAQHWDIFKQNKAQIEADFPLVTRGRQSESITDAHTVVYGAENLFIEKGADIRAAVINAENGSVYIGRNARVDEGALIRGAFALCEGGHVSMGAKIRENSTVGPYAKVGGEVKNSVIFGHSNKGHDGFLGNSVVGEWCNLGAATNTSNLKNNYRPVKLWSYAKRSFVNTGQQFCGLIMGDHAKCGINTLFNTGTVVGVGAHLFGSGFPANFVPSFSWGGAGGFTTFQPGKFYELATEVMRRKSKEFDEQEKQIIAAVFAHSKDLRIWEN